MRRFGRWDDYPIDKPNSIRYAEPSELAASQVSAVIGCGCCRLVRTVDSRIQNCGGCTDTKIKVNDARAIRDAVVIVGSIIRTFGSRRWVQTLSIPIECCIDVPGTRPGDQVAKTTIKVEYENDTWNYRTLHSTICVKVSVAVTRTYEDISALLMPDDWWQRTSSYYKGPIHDR